MSGLIFAKGRAGQTALTEVALAGAMRIALAGASSTFAAGQALLASEADGTEVEWLGKATAVDAAGVTFSRPLARSKNTGALLWRAASILETPAEAMLPLQATVATGVAVERTLAGGWLAAQTAEPAVQAMATLDGLIPSRAQALLDWLAVQAGWGLWAFTLLGGGMEPTVVRLAGADDRAIKQEWRAGGRARLTLPLWIVQRGGYQ
jgi:hypothetical protein